MLNFKMLETIDGIRLNIFSKNDGWEEKQVGRVTHYSRGQYTPAPTYLVLPSLTPVEFSIDSQARVPNFNPS